MFMTTFALVAASALDYKMVVVVVAVVEAFLNKDHRVYHNNHWDDHQEAHIAEVAFLYTQIHTAGVSFDHHINCHKNKDQTDIHYHNIYNHIFQVKVHLKARVHMDQNKSVEVDMDLVYDCCDLLHLTSLLFLKIIKE